MYSVIAHMSEIDKNSAGEDRAYAQMIEAENNRLERQVKYNRQVNNNEVPPGLAHPIDIVEVSMGIVTTHLEIP